jgi:hypothetical protein
VFLTRGMLSNNATATAGKGENLLHLERARKKGPFPNFPQRGTPLITGLLRECQPSYQLASLRKQNAKQGLTNSHTHTPTSSFGRGGGGSTRPHALQAPLAMRGAAAAAAGVLLITCPR